MNTHELATVPLWTWILIALILFIQSTFLFITSKKVGRNSWFWGIIGMVQFPIPTLTFLLLSWRDLRKISRS